MKPSSGNNNPLTIAGRLLRFGTGEACRFRVTVGSGNRRCKHKMIEPFSEKQVREGVISYGLSSYGYDLRVSDEFKIFTNVNSAIIDPKAFDERSFVSVQADSVIVPPNSFALARSVEYFRIPRDVLTICVGKSTYARCGIIVNVTPFEPEWEGFVTLGDFQHHAAAGQDLRQRGTVPDPVLPRAMSRARSATPIARASTRISRGSYFPSFDGAGWARFRRTAQITFGIQAGFLSAVKRGLFLRE